VYVDGKPDGSVATTGQIKSNDYNVYIGANMEANQLRWNGAIGDARAYSYALSDSDIEALYAGLEPMVAIAEEVPAEQVAHAEEEVTQGAPESGGDGDQSGQNNLKIVLLIVAIAAIVLVLTRRKKKSA